MAFSIAVVQKTQFMHHSHDSGHKEHALSNVRYLKPPHLVTHRIRNEIQKKKNTWDAGMVHGFGFAQEIPPVICVRLSKCRDRLWQFYTAPDGKQSFPPSHWLQAWHSIETFTQVHTNTHTYMNTSIPSEPLWQINMPENHRDWFRTVFKLGQTRATVKFTVPPEGRQQSILETKRKTRNPCLSKSICEAPKSHEGQSVAVVSTMLTS